MQFYMLYTPKQQTLIKTTCTGKIMNIRQMVKFTAFKTSQILEAVNAAPIHSSLCEVILFYDSLKIIMQIVTFCSGVNEVSTVLGYDASHWVIYSWRFQTTQCSHLQGSKCPRTLGTNYPVTKHHITKEETPPSLLNSQYTAIFMVKQENFRTHTIMQLWIDT